ncbi:MAG: Denitrification system component NirT [Gammaproteobacteria bacterium]|nr:Denitrification system component NirT [Gammaproteobacteria bacterium]
MTGTGGSRLWRRRRLLLGLPVGALIAFALGVVAWIGFHASLEASNSLTFCTSCHEMATFVYPEYQRSAHYRNVKGVRAVCADCHVPAALGPKLVRKVQATLKELPGHFLGVIDTREKFEARRSAMAMRVWAQMRASDSRECRGCHSYDAMALDMQERSAAKKHSPEWRERFGDTCIDCHFGVAHEVPDGLTPADLGAQTGS